MSKTENVLSGEEIREWSTKDLVIAELSSDITDNRSGVEPLTPYGVAPDGIRIQGYKSGSDMYNLRGEFPVHISRFSNDGNRRIGYIAGVNSDGSYNLYVLGNGNINLTPTHRIKTVSEYYINGDMRLLPPATEYYLPEHASDFGPYVWITDHVSRNDREARAIKRGVQTYVTENEAFMYQPTWEGARDTCKSVAYCATKGNNYVIDSNYSNIELTTNTETTLHLGVALECNYWQRSGAGFYYGDKNIGGDLFDLFSSITLTCVSGVANMPESVAFSEQQVSGPSGQQTLYINNNYPPFSGTMAFHYTPYNLILTYSLSEAQNYVATGELPSDAFLYPFDVDNIPINEDGGSGADSSDGTQGDGEGTGGDTTWEDCDDQDTEEPTKNGQALTNNNLYWLTSAQLKEFIEWFWTDATDVSDPSTLFEKIQGLYENLSQAVINVRYMPVDIAWIGGAHIDPSIIVGPVEKTGQVQAINKVPASVQNLGSIFIGELSKQNPQNSLESINWDGFINYSPYCQMSLYLPFHGFIDLDADLVMNSTLTIKAVYDILSGTIQYFIFRTAKGSTTKQLINTVCAKMATDIPISLQTKTDRDSAIFSNVAGATANLIGAGASLATGNPIGMVMSTANIASTQPQGAPMSLKGTISENGAYYDSGYCAIYVKRPGVNVPPNYASHLGYPCNSTLVLNKVHGFCQCENPYIDFTAPKSEDDEYYPKPTAEEIDTIYQALTDGIILP